ncbi:MAG: hypothetical protein M1825_003270 [Sarcosagium campestre]|nr:MAG: hypothetical protein M1825_003270 [Sarcosagium campestre]
MADEFDFHRRFQLLKDSEGAKNQLIEELLYKCDALSHNFQQLSLDREREVYYNRDIQKVKSELEADIRRMKASMDRNPFIVALIDGDGMVFKDDLLQNGEKGGKDAAALLWSAIHDYIERELPNLPSDCKIVGRVYANLRGLSETCFKAGIVDHPSKVEDFARGFTRSKHLFDFVDVGSGKDRADDKLAEVFKLHLHDCHCRQILFGCSHDNGYARLLEEYTTDVASASRICLLEGVPFERELDGLRSNFKSTKFPNFFRTTKITVQQTNNGVQPLSHNQYAPLNRTVSQPTPSQATSALANGSSLSAATPPSSWASAAMIPPAAMASPPATPKPVSAGPQGIPRNRKGQRIDPDIKHDRSDLKRVKAIKMCNVHHLRGDCPYGNACSHVHDYKPTAGELAILKMLARQCVCRSGTDCEDTKCIYGHRCYMGSACYRDSCRFPDEMHNIDTQIVRSIRI